MPRDRVRVGPLTAWRIEDTSRRENRSFPESLAALVSDGYAARKGSMPPAGADDGISDLADSTATNYRTICCHSKISTVEALHRFAKADNRSPSSAMNEFLRSGLMQRGFLRATTTLANY